jgi:ribosomal protein S12 methylthiotransferase
VKKQRVEELMLAQQQVAFAKSKSMIGKTLEVLIDSGGPASAGPFTARSQSQAPDIDSVVFVHGRELHIGQLTNVKVTDYQAYDLVAEVPTSKSRTLKVLSA